MMLGVMGFGGGSSGGRGDKLDSEVEDVDGVRSRGLGSVVEMHMHKGKSRGSKR